MDFACNFTHFMLWLELLWAGLDEIGFMIYIVVRDYDRKTQFVAFKNLECGAHFRGVMVWMTCLLRRISNVVFNIPQKRSGPDIFAKCYG